VNGYGLVHNSDKVEFDSFNFVYGYRFCFTIAQSASPLPSLPDLHVYGLWVCHRGLGDPRYITGVMAYFRYWRKQSRFHLAWSR